MTVATFMGRFRVEILEFHEPDGPPVIALWTSVFGDVAPHNRPEMMIRCKLGVQRDLFFVALLDGRLVGTVMGGYDGHRGWIYCLAVDPEVRRRGIGTALLRHVEHALAARGCPKINLQVRATKAATVAFYEKHRYIVEERISMGKIVCVSAPEHGHDHSDRRETRRTTSPSAGEHGRDIGSPVTIRGAEPTDLDAITAIYNEAILTTTATFDTEPKTVSERLSWFQSHGERYPILVAEVDGAVVGWTSLSKWSERPAYDDTAETSFYVKDGHHGRGIGRALKGAIIEEARRLRFHSLIARVAEGSLESIHLNESFGFQHVGLLREVGRKFDRLLGVHIFQMILDR
jgi:phosphinothricin acetyltransferase